MLYEDIQQRYGNHVAKRVQRELSPHEFKAISVDHLHDFLDRRAEKAVRDYKLLMDNPLDRGSLRCETLQKLWRDAEDLAYLVSVAEDVSTTVRAALVSA